MRFTRLSLVLSLATAMAQTPAGPTVIRTETRVVLVDAVVTDKAGNAIKGLTAKDFHVFEDNKEQAIQTATFVADAAIADAQKSYLVLFFDNSTLDYAAQGRAREAAVQFIEGNGGPNKMMAVVNGGSGLAISQNFTTDVDKLKRVAAEPHGGAAVERTGADPNAFSTMGNASQSRAAATSGFGAEAFLSNLKQLATNLAAVPGRKSVVLFSSGFVLPSQLTTQLNSAMQACNRSDLALYPVDVNGLSQSTAQTSMATAMDPKVQAAAKGQIMHPTDTPSDTSASTQQVLYTIANNTGGYVYANANSLAAGLMKIGREQTDYYLLGYSPTDSPDGSCHPLKVKVDKGGTNVRARANYCNVKSQDLLSGKPVEKELEYRLTGDDAGKVTASMQVPFFYPEADSARLNVAMDIPSKSIAFDKTKGKSHAEVNILGIAYMADGKVGARFSDTVKLDFGTQKELDAFLNRPLHYEKQFFVSPGTYKLKVAFSSSSDSFGKLEAPLTVEPYDGKTFMLSGLALSKEARPANELGSAQDAELLEGRTPLVYKDIRIVPSGALVFAKSDPVAVYGELYEPLLHEVTPPVVEIRMQVVDKKANTPKTAGAVRPDVASAAPGSNMLPFALKVKMDALTPGAYRMDVEAVDSAGKTMLRSIDFEIR